MYFKPLLIPLSYVATFLIPVVFSGKFKEGDIRLVGGGRKFRGTIVMYHKNRWGAVCDSMWGLNDATVACKQLGFRGALYAPTKSKFGPGRRRKWVTRMRCSGRETHLLKCSHDLMRTVGAHRCRGFFRSAGAVCTQHKTTQKIRRTNRSRRPSSRRRKRKRKPSKKTRKTTVTSTNSTTPTTTPTTTTTTSTTTTTTTTTTTPTTTTTSTTPTTTTTTSTSTTATTTPSTTTTPETTTKHIMSNLEEEIAFWASNGTHNETLAELDDEDLIKDHEKIKNDAPAVYETPLTNALQDKSEKEQKDTDKKLLEATEDVKKESPVLSDSPLHQDLEIRLLGGRYKWEGRLEVREKDGQWGVICSDHWTMKEVMVSCTQLGELGLAKQALTTSYFGGNDVYKRYYRVDCVGREDNLGKCNLTKTDNQHLCSKRTNVAGVVCSLYLPDLVPNIKALQHSARLQDQPLYYLRCAMEENCLASSAYELKKTSNRWRNNMRRLFRFSTIVHNSGNADFRPYRGRNQWEWHACHMHYHSMEVFAHYDIMDSNGTRLAEGSKASFCLEDTVCDRGFEPNYNCKGLSDQGLSVNCSDNYMYDIDCQWIDVTDLKPGDYTFLMEINPSLLVAESNFDNNVVSCEMYYNGYYANLRHCQYQSLLDYRRPQLPKDKNK